MACGSGRFMRSIPNIARQFPRFVPDAGSRPILAAGRSAWRAGSIFDLFWFEHVTLRTDSRYGLPFADASCRGIHVEHFFEHLNHADERHVFLAECFRCLEENGVLRIVVPDAALFVAAYLSPGWDKFREIAAVSDDPEANFPTKMAALNHVFIQDFEHYGGYDEESLSAVLQQHGFRTISRRSFRTGRFPEGCIDREQHKPLFAVR